MKLSQIMPPPVGAFPVYTTPPAAQPAQQEPVAWAVFEGWNAHDLYLPQEYDEALKMAQLKGVHAEVRPLYTTPPAATLQDAQPLRGAMPWEQLYPQFERATPPAAQRERVVFPTMLRKMWSGGEVQAWLDENVNGIKGEV
jgi:hypothetical protein